MICENCGEDKKYEAFIKNVSGCRTNKCFDCHYNPRNHYGQLKVKKVKYLRGCIFCKKLFVRTRGNRIQCPSCFNKYGAFRDGRENVRMRVRIRDNFTCQQCGAVRTLDHVNYFNKGIKGLKGKIKLFDVHHLNGECGKRSLAYDRKEEIDGLITLCHKCHYNQPEHRCKSKDFNKHLTFA